MSASDHIQPFQMKLFMQAKELMDLPSDDSWNSNSLSSDHGMTEEKLDESHLPWDDYDNAHGLIFEPTLGHDSLYDSIKKTGVQTPVQVRLARGDSAYKPFLTNGNHRTVVAHDIDPEMYVPVEYTDKVFGR